MSLTKQLRLYALLIFVIVAVGTTIFTISNVRKEIYENFLFVYSEYLRGSEEQLNTFFKDIETDLMTLTNIANLREVKGDGFTNFLEANEATFTYNYSEQELELIRIFNEFRINHPHINSVYLGLENGSFVRSHPRSSPTKYDPRERPWYKAAVSRPESFVLTDSYSSVTNTDINIGTVLSIKNTSSIIIGVVGIDVTLEYLNDMFRNKNLLFDGVIEIWDKNNIVWISKDKHQLNKASEDFSIYKEVYSAYNLTLEKSVSHYRVIKNIDYPSAKLIAYAPNESVDALMWNTLAERLLFVSISLILMLSSLLFIMNKFLLNPIREMSKTLKLSSSIGLPVRFNAKTSGELNELQAEYNKLIDIVESEEAELKRIKLMAINSLSSLVNIRDQETGLHIARTQKYVELLAMAYNEISKKTIIAENHLQMMVECAPLHDIGKVAIPDAILQKPGPLSFEEFELMKTHTTLGKDTIEKSSSHIGDQLFLKTVISIVHSHHERWDGNGYPDGLIGEDIPIEARIMSIADVYDAIRSKRVYKEAQSHEDALEIIISQAGRQFDPTLVDAFVSIEKSFKLVSELYKE